MITSADWSATDNFLSLNTSYTYSGIIHRFSVEFAAFVFISLF